MKKKKLRKVVVCSITDCFVKNFERIIIFYHDFRLQPSLYKKDFCPVRVRFCPLFTHYTPKVFSYMFVKQNLLFLSLYLGFLPRIFTIYRITSLKGGKLSLYIFFYHFHSLHGHLDISRVISAHLYEQLTTGLKPGTFGFLSEFANHEATRSSEFALSAIAIAAAVFRKMLKTRETLGNISPVLLNLITTPPPPDVQAVNIHVFS